MKGGFQIVTLEEVKEVFSDEFRPILSKFEILDIPITKAKSFHEAGDRPGVYIYWKNNQVLKVGRHLVNARTRALEHIRDNTGGEMDRLDNDPNCHLILFTVDKSDLHWAATPEMFLELRLSPKFKSGRLG